MKKIPNHTDTVCPFNADLLCFFCRPLKTARDLERNKGKEVEVRLKKAEGKKKKFIGGLVAFDELTLTLSLKGEDKIFKREEMESVRPYIGF